MSPKEGTRRESVPQRISELSIDLTPSWEGKGEMDPKDSWRGHTGSQAHEEFQNSPLD